MYVRDSLVMANYERKEYMVRIILDALADYVEQKEYMQEVESNIRLQKQIMSR